MKNQTKLRIINWITKLLKYKTPPIPIFKEESRKVIHLHINRIITESAKENISEDALVKMIGHDFIDLLLKDGFITCKIEPHHTPERIGKEFKMSAHLCVITKPKIR